MNKKNILTWSLILLSTLTLSSCLKEDDEVFDQSASKRLTEYLSDTKEALTSAEYGWVFNYYPDRDQTYGGYAYTVKFDDQNVEARCELDDPSNAETSTYTLCNEDGPCLLFDTYNSLLHFFATPSGSSGAGGYEAYDGDQMFMIMDIAEDGNTITLKGCRTGNTMTMTKLTEDAESYLTKVLEMESLINKWKMYTITMGLKTVFVDATGGNYFNFETDEEIAAPGIFTPEGLVFYEPVEVFGKTIEGVTAVVNGDEVTYCAINNPSIVFEPYNLPVNQQLVTGKWYISYSGFSAYGQKYYDYVIKGQASIGETMDYAYIGADDYGNFAFCFESSGYVGSLVFQYAFDDQNDHRIQMKFAMQGTDNGVWYHNNANYAYALFPFGYSSARVFTITADDDENPTELTLTDENNANNVIKLSATMISDPLNN